MNSLKFLIVNFIIIFSSLTTFSFGISSEHISSSLTTISKEPLKVGVATYEGEVKNGKANGIGIFTFPDGSIYEGQVKKTKLEVMENIQTLTELFMKESLGMEHLSLK